MEWTPARIRLLREVGLCLSQDGFAAALGFAKRTVGNAERGVHPPGLALRRALDQALEKASDAQRDRFLAALPADHDHGAAPVIHATSPTLESVELLRRTEASDLGPSTLEQLEELVERLGMEYFAVPPAEFRETVLSWRRYVARLLDGKLTLRQRRHLYAVAGWLSGLVAEASLAVDDEAETHCATALSLAHEVGDAHLAGWVRGTQAQIALYAGDPREAVAFAQAGRQVAPAGSNALVRSCTHEARASARIGDRVGMQIALDAAENAWNVLPKPHVRTIYSLGTSYIPYCSATAFVWLGDQVHARMCASHAVELADTEPEPTVSTQVSVRADLAIALTQAHELDAAAAVAIEAMDFWTLRRAYPARKRIHECLAVLQPYYHEPCVINLKERWQWISG
ncbi:MAG: helix-turn-helix domain-containing protein [Pseudonocardiaceae bacterium]